MLSLTTLKKKTQTIYKNTQVTFKAADESPLGY